MTETQPEPIIRDAERSKTAILQAATKLFCSKGFNATSIGDIATTAGVARGTPAYFFGSKENLYKAVLESVLQTAYQIVPTALQQVGENPSPQQLIEVFTDSYMNFHFDNPNFLRLIHWVSLEGNQTLINDVQAHWGTLSAMMQAVILTLKGTKLEQEDQRHMVLTIIGICNAHLVYGNTVAAPLGFDWHSPDFLEQRKNHIKHILKTTLQIL